MPAKAKTVNFRNPIYVVYVAAGLALLIFAARGTRGGTTATEAAVMRLFDLLPGWLDNLFKILWQLGSLSFVMVLAAISLITKRYKAALKFSVAGAGAYIAAVLCGHIWSRSGFPSTHMAVATALAMIGYQYTTARWHKAITWTVLVVAFSGLAINSALPLDLIGGYAIGLATGSAVSLWLGRRIIARVSTDEVLAALKRTGFPVKNVKVLGVDARGSSPFMVTGTTGQKYFLKVVNSDNFIADWLFKTMRKVMYSRMEDEAPFLTPKRQIEHESYVANLAYANRIRTPKVVGVIEIKDNHWAQIQEAVDGASLDKVEPSRINDAVLAEIFEMVNQLHDASIIHRDLRAANIFLDGSGQPWLIDFGFSEASIRPSQTYRDLVEMIASLGVIVGPDRIVKLALKHVPKDQLKNSLGYMQYASLSGETTRLMKLHEGMLAQIVEGLSVGLQTKMTPMRMRRFVSPARRK